MFTADASTDKMLKSDIIIHLKPRDGKPMDSMGLVDTRLFSGSNRLHAKLDKETMLWYCEYDNGIVPQPLAQRWTSWRKLLDFVKGYFDMRNIDIVKVDA